METSRIPCTVAILTKNSAATLPRALKTAADFAEIVICDGGSTDETIALATAAGARVISQDPTFLYADGRIADFAGVRNQTLTAATQPWFFFLDSDEYLSAELVERTRAITQGDAHGAYFISRRYVYENQEIMCAAAYPSYSMRFFARASADCFIKRIHERIRLVEGASVTRLAESLYVPIAINPARAKYKREYYLQLQLKQEGFITWHNLLYHITWRTIRTSLLYLFRFTRNLIFCHGKRLPLYFEIDNHGYNMRLIVLSWQAKWRQYFSAANGVE